MSSPIGCKRGLGLCLSGGGFRASFYHIGVLIQMAEQGLLGQVEVISTVSGGSIVGAAYYLKIKNLLESRPDSAIGHADYIKLVNELESEFLTSVQNNLRMRTFVNPLKNIRMTCSNYSRSDAIAELYEEYIYKQYLKPPGEWVSMRDLLIRPENKDISPCDEELGNDKRTNKIPVIILNATSLNSGHNWYFSARSMGEVPPRNSIFKDIDKKDRYRRIRYDEIKTDKKDFPLASAVAASAGVPGLFPPMAVSGMYDKRRVQLVDGGVFDNQGVSGALDELHTCNSMVVSDASGQSDAVENPDTGLVNVLGLTNSIMMGRIREEVVCGLNETLANSTTHPKRMAYFHLTRGLFAKNINVIEQKANLQSNENQIKGIKSSKDDFGVDQEMQKALAHMRTDLDSFTDIEAGCLVADGYLMSKKQLEEMKTSFSNSTSQGAADSALNWNYKVYVDKLANNDAVVRKHLEIASKLFFKPLFHLFGGTLNAQKKLILVLSMIPLAIFFAGLYCGLNLLMLNFYGESLWAIITQKEKFVLFMNALMPGIYSYLVFIIMSFIADKFIEGSAGLAKIIRYVLKFPMMIATSLIIRLILPVLGFIPVWLYLITIDRVFVKKIGKLD
jgi:predicted acylesterase/phospholipase RssA